MVTRPGDTDTSSERITDVQPVGITVDTPTCRSSGTRGLAKLMRRATDKCACVLNISPLKQRDACSQWGAYVGGVTTRVTTALQRDASSQCGAA
jgi:hypothetical protein